MECNLFLLEFGTSPGVVHISHIPPWVISSGWQALQVSLSIVGTSPGLGQFSQYMPSLTNWLGKQAMQEMRSSCGTSPEVQSWHSPFSAI